VDSPAKYIDAQKVNDLVKAVLSHHKEYIEKYGSSAHHYLLDEIENLLLEELRNKNGIKADKENTKRAAAILKESEKLRELISKENNMS